LNRKQKEQAIDAVQVKENHHLHVITKINYMYYKLTLLLVVISLSKTSYSQKTSVGINGGITLASIHAKGEEESMNSDSKIGFMGGLFLETPISKNVLFNPAINFVQKGFAVPDLEPDEMDKTTLNYLELPLNVLYTTDGFVFGGGPVLGLGLSGKEKYKGSNGDIITDDIKFGSGQEEVKQIEFSGNLLAGYKLKNGLMVSAGYNMGFTNLINGDDVGGSIKNRYWSFKIGYVFSKK